MVFDEKCSAVRIGQETASRPGVCSIAWYPHAAAIQRHIMQSLHYSVHIRPAAPTSPTDYSMPDRDWGWWSEMHVHRHYVSEFFVFYKKCSNHHFLVRKCSRFYNFYKNYNHFAANDFGQQGRLTLFGSLLYARVSCLSLCRFKGLRRACEER